MQFNCCAALMCLYVSDESVFQNRVRTSLATVQAVAQCKLVSKADIE